MLRQKRGNITKYGKWISVKDRLPKETEDVIVYIDCGYITSSEVYKDEVEGTGFSIDGVYGDVTHWMPKPANKIRKKQWISVEDKVPESYENVVIYHENGEVNIGTYLKGIGRFTLESCYGKVTHWMPLPKAPENIPDDAAIKEFNEEDKS